MVLPSLSVEGEMRINRLRQYLDRYREMIRQLDSQPLQDYAIEIADRDELQTLQRSCQYSVVSIQLKTQRMSSH